MILFAYFTIGQLFASDSSFFLYAEKVNDVGAFHLGTLYIAELVS